LRFRIISYLQLVHKINKAIKSMMDFIAIVKNIMSDDGSVSVKHHIGITVHISSISNVKRVDYHTFYLPYDVKAIDIKANRIEQWKNLCSFIDDIHDNAVPDTPNSDCRHCSSVWCQTISQTAERSRPMGTVTCFSLAAVYTLSRTLSRAVSVQ